MQGTGFQKICGKRKFVLFISILAACTGSSNEIEYYNNGSIHYVVPLKNGKRNGLLEEYNKDGSVKSSSEWKDGVMEGKLIHYFPNGNIEQEHLFKKGVRCCESKFYYESGEIREVQYLDMKGKLINYKKYNIDGTQNFNLKSAIVITNNDTVQQGDEFEALIRLGNRELKCIEVILGDPYDSLILLDPKLPKFDDTTALFKVRSEQLGRNTITGVIVDIDRDERIMMVIPLEFSFYVE